jgi:hypothetical protein
MTSMTDVTAIPVITVMRARVTPISRVSVTSVMDRHTTSVLVDNRGSLSLVRHLIARWFFLPLALSSLDKRQIGLFPSFGGAYFRLQSFICKVFRRCHCIYVQISAHWRLKSELQSAGR